MTNVKVFVRTDSLDRDEKLELTKLLEKLRILTRQGRIVLNIHDQRVTAVEIQSSL